MAIGKVRIPSNQVSDKTVRYYITPPEGFSEADDLTLRFFIRDEDGNVIYDDDNDANNPNDNVRWTFDHFVYEHLYELGPTELTNVQPETTYYTNVFLFVNGTSYGKMLDDALTFTTDKATTTYKIKINYNKNCDATTVTNMPTSQTASSSSRSVPITLNSKTPKRTDGYIFKGWMDPPIPDNVNSLFYKQPGQKYNFYGSNKTLEYTLYARWALEGYSALIYYHSNGGSGGPKENFIQKIDSSDLSFVISDSKPTKIGYTFKGWAKTEDATEADYVVGDTYSLTGSYGVVLNIELYAVWEQQYTLIMKYQSGEGKWADGNTEKETVQFSETLPLVYSFLENVPVADQANYIFYGWQGGPDNYIYEIPNQGKIEVFEAGKKEETYTYTAIYKPQSIEGAVYINKKLYIPWICTDNGWKQAIVWICTDDGWKQAIGSYQ